jgi:hypothetical protein
VFYKNRKKDRKFAKFGQSFLGFSSKPKNAAPTTLRTSLRTKNRRPLEIPTPVGRSIIRNLLTNAANVLRPNVAATEPKLHENATENGVCKDFHVQGRGPASQINVPEVEKAIPTHHQLG